MRTYGQYRSIARASEVLAERWTPIILRDLLLGCTTFSEIAAGAPGLSRTLLTTRLRELERAGVVQTAPNPSGRRSRYHLTEAGRDLPAVMRALGTWGGALDGAGPRASGPGVALHSWVSWYLARALPTWNRRSPAAAVRRTGVPAG
jgi:DNA-binding HxlR family transcriptional regulator